MRLIEREIEQFFGQFSGTLSVVPTREGELWW